MTDPRCGTYAGYNAHIARSQTPCDACRKAASEYSAEWRRKNPAARAALAALRERCDITPSREAFREEVEQ